MNITFFLSFYILILSIYILDISFNITLFFTKKNVIMLHIACMQSGKTNSLIINSEIHLRTKQKWANLIG